MRTLLIACVMLAALAVLVAAQSCANQETVIYVEVPEDFQLGEVEYTAPKAEAIRCPFGYTAGSSEDGLSSFCRHPFFSRSSSRSATPSASSQPGASQSSSAEASASPSPQPSELASVGASASAEPSVGASASAEPSVGASASAEPSVGASASAEPSVGASASAEPSVGASASSEPSQPASQAASASASSEPSQPASQAASASASASSEPSQPASQPASASASASVPPSESTSPSAGASSTSTASQSAPPSSTSTASQSAPPSSTSTASLSASASVSTSNSPSGSTSLSNTPSVTPSITSTSTATLSAGASASNTPSVTPSTSLSGTPSTSLSRTPSTSLSSTASATRSPSASGSTSVSPSTSILPSTTSTASASASRSPVPSASPSTSILPSTTSTASASASASASRSPVPSASPSTSILPSTTSTASASASASASRSPVPSASPSTSILPSTTSTASASASRSPVPSASSSASASRSPAPASPSPSSAGNVVVPTGPFTQGKALMFKPTGVSPSSTQTGCPSGGTSWATLSGSAITVPAGTVYYVPPGRWPATGQYASITIDGELYFQDGATDFHVASVTINSGGKLRMGSATCRLNGPISMMFHGDKTVCGTNDPSCKGIYAKAGSLVDLFGKEYHHTWTRLAQTEPVGATTLHLQDPVNWVVGQKIVITTTILMDNFQNQNEELTVMGISNGGYNVEVSPALAFNHYGGQEYQAEVGLLSRNIILQGDASALEDTQKFGGHVMMMGAGHVAGVLFYRMGQQNVLARYPIHFHRAGLQTGSYISDCAVWKSFYRCYVVHRTNNVLVTRNVAYDVAGHCYYCSEDGNEVDSTFSYNLAARVAIICDPGMYASGGVQEGEFFQKNANVEQPADCAAGGFYITNAANSFIGNAASGGWAGFSIVGMRTIQGGGTETEPSRTNFVEFKGNSVHSTGYYWTSGSCIYIGGRLDEDAGVLRYSSGRNDWNGAGNVRDTRADPLDTDSARLWLQMSHTRVALCVLGINQWGERLDLTNYEATDTARGAVIFGEASIVGGVINAKSSNPQLLTMRLPHQNGVLPRGALWVWPRPNDSGATGFQFYDTAVKSILVDVEFRNFVRMASVQNNNPAADCVALISMTHSDQFKPYGINGIRDLKFTNTNKRQRIGHDNSSGTGSGRQFNMMDFDGSTAGTGVKTIIGSHSTYWNLPNAGCTKDGDWSIYRCPAHDIEIGGIALRPNRGQLDNDQPCSSFSSNPAGRCGWGKLHHWGYNDRYLLMTGIADVLAVTSGETLKLGQHYIFDNAPTALLTIHLSMIPFGKHILFSTPYPAGSTVTWIRRGCGWCNNQDTSQWGGWDDYTTLTAATDLAGVVADPDGNRYFMASNGILYLKLKDTLRTEPDFYERSGVKLYRMSWDEGGMSTRMVINVALGGGAVSTSIPPSIY